MMEQWQEISLGTALGMALLIIKDVVHSLLQRLRINGYGHDHEHRKPHPTIREYITEVWQDKTGQELAALRKGHDAQMKRLRNIRDICRDIARERGLEVHFDEED